MIDDAGQPKTGTTLRILALGDCVGRPGRRCLREGVPRLRQTRGVDFAVANIENAAAGFGVTPKIANQVLAEGVDVLTSGDHIRDRREIDTTLASEPRLLRPMNYTDMPGRGVGIYEGPGGVRIAIANIMGQAFLDDWGNPLEWAERALAEMGDAPVKLFDLHGEATAEKVALGWMLDGRVSAVWGSHTHVQTADECVLPKGTGYITDLGFVGPHKSVLGRDVERVLNKMLGREPAYMEVASDWLQLDGAIFEIDLSNGLCLSVERVRERIDTAI